MKKTVGQFSTEVKISVDEATNICKLKQGEQCCAFLAFSHSSFQCIRMTPEKVAIFNRLDAGTMRAKGEGGWSGCAFEGEL
jgi:hypothetical protein